MQLAELAYIEKVPAGQAVQEVGPEVVPVTTLKVPGKQERHCDTGTLAFLKVPLGHGTMIVEVR